LSILSLKEASFHFVHKKEKQKSEEHKGVELKKSDKTYEKS